MRTHEKAQAVQGTTNDEVVRKAVREHSFGYISIANVGTNVNLRGV